ncbi:MAG: hypothetical protein M0Z94_00890 [Dehalococcoidales bacterium]|nr:hypothetical protein [Dehalococcoidales bacterium]
MDDVVRLWKGAKPGGAELERRVRRELGIVRSEGYRLVRDRWGQQVNLDLWRVIEHIANHPTDHRRWELIPAIIPSIKRARDRGRTGTRITYEANLPVATRRNVHERVLFTTAIILSEGERVFDSIVAPTHAQAIEKIRKRAGISTRPNPVALTSASDTAGTKRTARRLRGAAAAPREHDNTGAAVATRIASLFAALFG